MKKMFPFFIAIISILLTLVGVSSCGTVPEKESVLVVNGPLVITEFMCYNRSALQDTSGDFPDWLELENRSTDTVFLQDYGLTDSQKSLSKFQFMNGAIPPNGHLVLFASGTGALENHVNFKLNKARGKIFLTKENKILQEIKYPRQTADHSYVLVNGRWHYSEQPSPGMVNSTTGVKEGLASPVEIIIEHDSGKSIVTIKSKDKGDIKYALNGASVFSAHALTYSKPFEIVDKTTLEAAVFEESLVTDQSTSAVYINYKEHKLPVVSLITNPENLWNDSTGIYVKGLFNNYKDRSKASERSGYLVFHGADGFTYEEQIEFKLYGTGTRVLPKKSMTIKPKDGSMKNFLFDFNEEKEIDGFVMRACYLDGSRFKNEVVKGVNDVMNSKLLMQEYQPSVFYLNGDYWGVFNVYERKNTEFITAHTGKKVAHMLNGNSNLVMIEKGSSDSYLAFLDKLNMMDIRSSEAFELIESNFELESMMDFWVQELYTGKSDRFNNRFWKTNEEGAKWSYVGYDFDNGFRAADHPRIKKQFEEKEAKGIEIFKKCVQNPDFATLFFKRLCDYLNFGYTRAKVEQIITTADELTGEEFKADLDRWSKEFPKVSDEPEAQKEEILVFVDLRGNYLRNSIAPLFGFDTELIIRNSVPEDYAVLVNGYALTDDAIYFKGMEIQIEKKAIASDSKTRWLLNGVEVNPSEDMKINEGGILELVAL